MAGLTDLALRILIGAEDRTGPAFKTVKQGTQSISDSLAKVETIAKRVLDIRLFAGWAQDGIKLSDTYRELQAKIRQVVGESGNLAGTQDRLFTIAQATATPLKDTITLYARSAEALRKVADGQELAAKLTETVNLSFKAQSTGTAEMTSTIYQLTQGIGTGTVTWEDFGNVAQANLLLTNVAAKNLGYDGIGELKKAISDGKITGEDMVRAIVQGFDEIKARADTMPLGVERSLVLVNNALIKFVGESNNANTAVSIISGGLQLLATHMNEAANAALALAAIYAGRLLSGLADTTKAYFAGAQAAKAKAVAEVQAQQAALALMRTESQVAALRIRAAQTQLMEAQLYAKIVIGTEKEIIAKKALTAAIQQLHAAQSQAAIKQAALDAALAGSTTNATLAARAFGLLKSAINGLFLIPLAATIAEWGLKMDWFHRIALRGQEGMVHLLEGAKAMADGLTLRERWAQIKATHEEFNQIIAKNTGAAKNSAEAVAEANRKTAEAEQKKAEAVEQAAAKQQAAFKVVEDATKELTASIDADTKTQTAIIEQSLTERLAAIDSLAIGEAEKDKLRVTAKLASYQQEVSLQQQASTQKLQLIDQEYAAELDKVKGNAQRVAEIETQKRQAKLAVYSGLAKYYQGEVGRLAQVYANEYSLAQQSKQQLLALNQSHEQALFNIKLMGMDEQHKLQAQQSEFDRLTYEAKREQAKGEKADQEKINRLLTDAKTLHGQITSAAGNGSSEIYKAKERENKIYGLQKTELEANAKAHEDNASRAKAAQAAVADKLETTRSAINEISAALNKDYALKIGLDQSALESARAVIADIVKPETKIITIQTVNAGGGNAPTGDAAVPGFATGTRLPGFGGGDKWPALLEGGEGVANKHAMRALDSTLGPGFFDGLNAGQNPLELLRNLLKSKPGVLKLAIGGRVKRKKFDPLMPGYYDDGSKIAEGYDPATVARAYDSANRMTMWETTGTTGASYRNKVRLFNSQLLTHLGPLPIAADNTDTGGNTGRARLPSFASPKLSIPIPSLPSIPQASAPAPAPAASSTMRVQFISPKNESVSGQFSASDATGLLRILKDSGAITA